LKIVIVFRQVRYGPRVICSTCVCDFTLSCLDLPCVISVKPLGCSAFYAKRNEVLLFKISDATNPDY